MGKILNPKDLSSYQTKSKNPETMKTLNSKLMRILLFGLYLLSLSTLSALNTPDLRIINAGLGKQFAVKVAGLAEAEAVFAVRTPAGKTLLQQAIHSEQYQAIFSLEHLPEGHYLLVLSTAKQEIVQPVELTRRAIRYDLNQRQLICKPVIRIDGRQLDVDFDNPQRLPIQLKLQTTDGSVLHQQEFTDSEEVELRMNLLQLPAGDYQLVLATNEQAWTETIRLR
ncbi:MAG: hypothetical protein D6772_08100 [Bacteroidetes bacterium]|nr:MAG: hypothetical protein D6772_08100 [Bacteroidota bacterium]